MAKLFTLSLLASAGLTLAAPSFAATRAGLDIRPLADARAELKPKAYSPEERELMAKQALMFIENLYVHREVKIKDFGAQVDPVPRLKDMVKRAPSMNDEEFHKTMQKIFLDLHDHHTNYSAPLPLRCSYAIAPLHFADVYDNGTLKVIVKGKTKVVEEAAGSEVSAAEPGDELVAINGKPIAEILEELRKWSGGANDDAMTMGAIMNLSLVPLAEQPVPSDNELNYELNRKGEKVTIKTRYFAAVNIPSCVKEAEGTATEKTFAPKPKKKKNKKNSIYDSAFVRGENPIVRDYKDLVLPDTVSPFGEDGKLPIGQFYTISTPAGKLAKFDLETFVPEDESSADDVIHKVKALLQDAQDKTQALIIDMRGNGGGLILLAEGLTQLFTPNNVATMPVRYLPTDLNLQTFLRANQGRENGWSQDTRDGISANARYTKPRVITSADAANRYGQVWFKPVVILTDATCYSACDLFAASMQDHGAATIIGTHATTGAGGANVMDYDIFRQIFDTTSSEENPFVKLPGAQSMRVSWRQTLRVGKSKDQLIENAGVKSDIVVRYVTEDVVGGESRVLMKEVHKAIKQILPRYKSHIALQSSLMMKNGAYAEWTEKVRGIDSLVVMHAGKEVAQYDVSENDKEITVSLTDVKGEWSEAAYDVVGKLNGKTQFRVVREVRWRGKMLDASKELSETFKDGLKFWHTQQMAGPSGEGWQTKGNVAKIGKGANYSPNTTAQLYASIATAGKETVTLDLAMKMETEDDMDYVNIIVRDPATGDEEYVASVSGTFDISPDQKIEIPTKGADQLEIVFEFMSDENWNMKGPEIRKLAIQTL